ncbi:MAG TPA: hypothetical protein DCP63_01840 [Bacteroidetes bacterium]|nr:hypothetical protein [Bacteroidota bacterium]
MGRIHDAFDLPKDSNGFPLQRASEANDSYRDHGSGFALRKRSNVVFENKFDSRICESEY